MQEGFIMGDSRTVLFDFCKDIITTLKPHIMNIIQFIPLWSDMLEVHDILFHHDSCVLLIGSSSTDKGEATGETEVTGLGVLRLCFRFLRRNPEKKILIIGHTDTSGGEAYNIQLSELRAENVLYCLLGDRKNWVDTTMKKYKVEDYQHILKYIYHSRSGWDCDPGPVDNVNKPKTRQAVRNFQKKYNEEFSQKIPEDGVVGRLTWGAIFDVYMKELEEMMLCNSAEMETYRKLVKFVDEKRRTVGCGEHYPIEQPKRDEYRSEKNRRVEILFFDPDELPDLSCHPSPGVCLHEKCRIHNPAFWRFRHLPAWNSHLELISVDDHFAPGKEKLTIRYSSNKQYTTLAMFRIISETYPGKIVFEKRVSESGNINRGKYVFEWDGKTSISGKPITGDLSKRYINGIYSPYKVQIVESGNVVDELPTKVIYHSVQLDMGDWVLPDNQPTATSDKVSWVQWQLNKFAYFSGPVDGSENPETKIAIKKYKLRHKDLYTDKTDTITNDLVRCLQSGDNSNPIFNSTNWFTDKDNTNGRLYIYHDCYYKEFSDLKTPMIRVNHEKSYMSRPSIPLAAKVMLLKKGAKEGDASGGIFSPEGVGPLRIDWTYKDPAEDLTLLPNGTKPDGTADNDVPSRTRQFVTKALTVAPPDPSEPGDNTSTEFEGIRVKNSHDNRQAFVPELQGKLPFQAKNDNAKKLYYIYAHADLEKNKGLLGKSIIHFKPTYISGDSYKIFATINFEGLPTEEQLKAAYPDPLQAESGTLTIWRKASIANWVAWNNRPDANDALNWNTVVNRFTETYIELVTAAADNRDSFLTWNEYKTLITNHCTVATYKNAVNAPGNPHGIDVSRFVIDDPLPRNPGESAAAYKARVDSEVNTIWKSINPHIVKQLETKLRPKKPEGLIVLDFKVGNPARVNAEGIPSKAVGSSAAWADKRGITMINVAITMDQDTLMAHEIGHNMYLSHWQVPATDGYRRPIDHDQSDNNCMMSYAWYLVGRPAVNADGMKFHGRFCGKCNLKLRGWHIAGPGMPVKS
jgi:peptidoglycan hydrolase-like protein with peptidoglycan-binding domain